ncbi:phosphoribosylformylglycinamidine synthase subunit PurQ, partial [Neisseria gonorrhoeae]|uniref:phosphoribosylformylglycinamidine synthase subunit PurQ n=1 Tax=Neisseria gonorrhoeae TaxID=485 RepID=UPI00155E4067
ADVKFDVNEDIAAPFINSGAKPKIAILREQGVNGQIEMAAAFFADPNTLTLGVCNGCQMVSNLAEIIPGAETWPKFKRNLS